MSAKQSAAKTVVYTGTIDNAKVLKLGRRSCPQIERIMKAMALNVKQIGIMLKYLLKKK